MEQKPLATVEAMADLIVIAIDVLTDEQLDKYQPSLFNSLRDCTDRISTTGDILQFTRALNGTLTKEQLSLNTAQGVAIHHAMNDVWRSIVEEWESTTVEHFGTIHPMVLPDSEAPCCEHGRKSFCVCGGTFSCPCHGGNCFGRYGHS